jgi:lysophospholipase L1-like esterase
MRARFPVAIGLALCICCALTGSPQSSASKKKSAAKRKTRKPAMPPISAAMRADAVQKVDRYLTESGESAIEQPGALVPFFEQLARLGTEAAAPVHIIHWGDSHTAADDWTGSLRDLFRERFGDGGSGFSVAGHPFPGYRRLDAHGGGTPLWQTVGGRAGNGDGWFGLGGVAQFTQRSGQTLWLDADCDRLEVHYLRQPNGGRLALYDTFGPIDTISTDGDSAAAFNQYPASPGTHRFFLRTLDSRPVRVFGWVADKASGVTYEALGLNGAEAGVLLKWDPAMLATYLQRRNPGLIVLAYGTNEASDPEWRTDSYRDQFARVIARLRQAAPGSPVLAIGPDDRWIYSGGKWRPVEGIEGIIADQRAVCKEAGCAYWDLRARMGGTGAMRDWVYAAFAQNDHVHFTTTGYRRLGAVLFGDLMQQFEAYRKARSAAEHTDHERPR